MNMSELNFFIDTFDFSVVIITRVQGVPNMTIAGVEFFGICWNVAIFKKSPDLLSVTKAINISIQ